MRNILTQTICACAVKGVLAFVSGCQTDNQSSAPSASAAPQTITPPAAPSSLTATGMYGGQIALSWAANSFDNPDLVSPQTSTITVGHSFETEAPARSLSVIRIKTRR